MSLVAIDCRFASYHAGLGRYTRELVSGLLKRDDPWEYVLLVKDPEEQWVKDLPSPPRTMKADFPHYSLAEQRLLPGLIRETGADLFFSPHFNAPIRCPVPFLITVHDLILHRFPNKASLLKRIAYRALMNRVVRSAQSVLTVSTFVADELTAMYGESIAAKVHVTFEGVNPHFSVRSTVDIATMRAKYEIPLPYFLYVGNAKQHKNVQMLIDAFEASALEGQELILISGGAEARALRLPRRVRLLQEVAEQDLPVFYAGAQAFVTASLYEGFCLPAAEALACGCPVIAADKGPLPEVTGGHAMLIEPTLGAFTQAFRHPPTDRTVRLLWDWAHAAERTATVIHRALGV